MCCRAIKAKVIEGAVIAYQSLFFKKTISQKYLKITTLVASGAEIQTRVFLNTRPMLPPAKNFFGVAEFFLPGLLYLNLLTLKVKGRTPTESFYWTLSKRDEINTSFSFIWYLLPFA